MKRPYYLFIGLALLVVLIDQASKWLVLSNIPTHQSLSAIPGFFNIVIIKNRGMAFGLFNQDDPTLSHFLLLLMTIVAIGLILFFFWVKKEHFWIVIGLSLILGGAVGNLIDRIHLGYVVDFLDFSIAGCHWPAFNMADSAVTVGTLWILLNVIRGKSL